MNIIPVTYEEAARKNNIFLALFQKQPLEEHALFSHLPARDKNALKKLWREEFKADEGETKSFWFSEGPIRRVRLFGLGEQSKWQYRRERLLPRRYVRYAKGERVTGFAANLSPLEATAKKEAATQFATEAILAHFEFNSYKEKPKEGWPEIQEIYLAADAASHKDLREGITEGTIIGEEANSCRVLANTPGSDMTPQKLAVAASAAGKRTGVKVKVLEEAEIKKLGMGGVLGVGRGSAEKPRFIILEYLHGRKGQKPLVLVGKGVTFDTGGLNLKPDEHIYEMHMDMSGGAAVIHGIAAIARLKLPINMVGLIPAVENMPSGSSYRPGDLLKSLSGKTIEVLNTDAEGRVILADGLAYGLRYKPGMMVDFATLTGAAHVALGSYCSAAFTNREGLMKKFEEVGTESGDYVWGLPLWDEYLEEIKGTFGDLANIGKGDRYGGAIHGAKFLEQFVDNVPWAHLDIAPRMTSIESDYLAKGATGVGVRYIVELAKEYPKLGINL